MIDQKKDHKNQFIKYKARITINGNNQVIDKHFTLASNQKKINNLIIEKLKSKIDLKIQQPNNEFDFLGIHIIRTKDSFILNCPKSKQNLVENWESDQILNEYKINCSTFTIQRDLKLLTDNNNLKLILEPKTIPKYLRYIGSLVYIGRNCCLPLYFQIIVLSSYNNKQNSITAELLYRTLAFLKKNPLQYPHIIKINGGNTNKDTYELKVYTDANFNNADGSSRYGFLIFLNGSLIDYKTSLIKKVIDSTTECEILALKKSFEQVILLKALLRSLEVKTHVIIYSDNLTAVNLVNRKPTTGQQKFRPKFNQSLLAIIEAVKDKYVEVKHINTSLNLADVLTKPLSKSNIERFYKEIFNIDKLT